MENYRGTYTRAAFVRTFLWIPLKKNVTASAAYLRSPRPPHPPPPSPRPPLMINVTASAAHLRSPRPPRPPPPSPRPPRPWQPMRQTACDGNDFHGCRAALTLAIFNSSEPPSSQPPDSALPFTQLLSRIKNHTTHSASRPDPPASLHALIWTTRSRYIALNSTVLWSTTAVAADSTHRLPTGAYPPGCNRHIHRVDDRCHRRSDTLVVYHRGHESLECAADVDGLVACACAEIERTTIALHADIAVLGPLRSE